MPYGEVGCEHYHKVERPDPQYAAQHEHAESAGSWLIGEQNYRDEKPGQNEEGINPDPPKGTDICQWGGKAQVAHVIHEDKEHSCRPQSIELRVVVLPTTRWRHCSSQSVLFVGGGRHEQAEQLSVDEGCPG
jgi:hypothetical protein